MSELLDEQGVLDAIENQKSWEELGFIKAGDEETIFIVSRESGYVAGGATGILALANTQNDAVYRLGRWEGEQAQAETMYALQAENARLRAVVDEAKEWHEQDCNCLCDCGECNKLPEPCALGASIAALGGRQ